MFTLTSAAAQQIHQTTESGGNAELALRIAARRDADGELHYGMGFDEATDEDTQLDLYGVAVVIAQEHQELLSDTVLDFVELQPGQFNFIFGDARLLESDATPAPATGGGCSSGSCASGGCSSKSSH